LVLGTYDLVFIGRTIEHPGVRRRLHQIDPKAAASRLVPKADELDAALADRDADWVYVRFVPTTEQVDAAHRSGKRVFLAGPAVSGREPDNWRRAREAGVDAILTDYPLECRQSGRPR
jgi:hypothetical protein